MTRGTTAVGHHLRVKTGNRFHPLFLFLPLENVLEFARPHPDEDYVDARAAIAYLRKQLTLIDDAIAQFESMIEEDLARTVGKKKRDKTNGGGAPEPGSKG
jgi:hypothetical protein